jgi:hypothetical protein
MYKTANQIANEVVAATDPTSGTTLPPGMKVVADNGYGHLVLEDPEGNLVEYSQPVTKTAAPAPLDPSVTGPQRVPAPASKLYSMADIFGPEKKEPSAALKAKWNQQWRDKQQRRAQGQHTRGRGFLRSDSATVDPATGIMRMPQVAMSARATGNAGSTPIAPHGGAGGPDLDFGQGGGAPSSGPVSNWNAASARNRADRPRQALIDRWNKQYLAKQQRKQQQATPEAPAAPQESPAVVADRSQQQAAGAAASRAQMMASPKMQAQRAQSAASAQSLAQNRARARGVVSDVATPQEVARFDGKFSPEAAPARSAVRDRLARLDSAGAAPSGALGRELMRRRHAANAGM